MIGHLNKGRQSEKMDLREGPLKPRSCGTDDFSKGTEGLAQKVL